MFEKEKDNKNTFTDWIRFYLRMACIKSSWSSTDQVRVSYHVFVMAVCSISGWVMFYKVYDDFTLNTDVLIHAVCTAHSLFLYLVYLGHKERLCMVAAAIEYRFQHLSGKLPLEKYKHVWDRADKLSMIMVRFGAYLCIAVYTFYIFNADLYSPKRKILYPMWVPFSVEPALNYMFIAALQLTVFSLYSFVHVSGHGLCVGGAHFIGASFDVLGFIFKDMCASRDAMFYLVRKKHTHVLVIHQHIVEEKLKWCIEVHKEILKLTNEIKAAYEGVLVEVLLSSEILICFSGFQIFLAVEQRDLGRIPMLACLMLLLILHLFLFCYPGQHIHNKSEKLRNTFYLSRWEEQSFKFQKDVMFILTSTTRPVSISYRDFVYASMHSFYMFNSLIKRVVGWENFICPDTVEKKEQVIARMLAL